VRPGDSRRSSRPCAIAGGAQLVGSVPPDRRGKYVRGPGSSTARNAGVGSLQGQGPGAAIVARRDCPPGRRHGMNAGCPAPDQLRYWLAGYPAGDEETGLAGHVESCPRCQQLLERFTAPDQSSTSSVNLFRERTATGSHESFLQRLIQGG